MFGAPMLPHDERYAVAQEWVDIIKQLWTSDVPFTFEGKHFKVTEALLKPRPLQDPYPILMSAGASKTGRAFGARNCDVLFINADLGQQSPDSLAEKVRDFKAFARDEFSREVQIWTNAYIVQGDTEQDAKDFLHHYVDEKGDWEAAQNLVDGMIGSSESFAEETLQLMKFHFIAGWAGYPIVGSTEQVVDTLVALSATGLDGIVLSWPRFVQDMKRFQEETYPLLVEAGVR